MKRVTGIGGIFFKANDPSKLHEWYEKHLGLKREPHNSAVLHWREADDPEKPGMDGLVAVQKGQQLLRSQ